MDEKLPQDKEESLAPTSKGRDDGPKQFEFASVSINAAIETFLKQNVGLAERIAHALAPFQEFFDRLSKSLELNREKIASGAQRALEVVQSIQAMAVGLPEHMRRCCSVLADHGWYADGDFGAGAAGDLAQAFETGNQDWANAELVADYKKRLPEIKTALFERYPHREKILNAAFAAHERGEYELSIPIFLIQADGICNDVTQRLMFVRDRKSGKPAVAQFAENFVSDNFHYAVLAPLTTVHSIASSEKDRSVDFDGLNRHQVLHGESLSYNTELNSFKAISLLSYLSWVLHMDRTDRPTLPTVTSPVAVDP
jgi:hypothetical protein